jgi:hypothetical protein
MTVQRSYSMPNCNLLVEGISLGDSDQLSMLTNFECTFNHTQDRISGGKELLSALIKCVSDYAQALQAGNLITTEVEAVRLEPESSYSHNLHVATSAASDGSKPALPSEPSDQAGAKPDSIINIQLSTVQLFDLLESLDRLCVDEKALSDLKVPLNIQAVRGQIDFKGKLIPAVSGIASFAIVAFGFFLLPVPEPIPEPEPQTENSSQTTETPAQTPPTPDSSQNSSDQSNSATENNPSDPSVAASPTPLPEAIADAELTASLANGLRQQIDDTWREAIDEDATFTVAINENGEIVGYKPTDVPAGIPLPDLLVIPIDAETGASRNQPQPTVSFEVTFRSNGDLDIEPVQ